MRSESSPCAPYIPPHPSSEESHDVTNSTISHRSPLSPSALLFFRDKLVPLEQSDRLETIAHSNSSRQPSRVTKKEKRTRSPGADDGVVARKKSKRERKERDDHLPPTCRRDSRGRPLFDAAGSTRRWHRIGAKISE